MIINNFNINDFAGKLADFWSFSGEKIVSIQDSLKDSNKTPVFTVDGKYVSQGWTEWTQGFQFGSALIQFEATGDEQFLEIGRRNTLEKMATHVSHTGVHDHGFNNLSTYGNLLRMMNLGIIPSDVWEKNFYELAVKLSGAVQANRWTNIDEENGFIYSFNGPHSLFVDTIRSCRIVLLSYKLGHVLQGENDVRISLLDRAVKHLKATAKYSVFYGEGRDSYDVSGRTAHESIFNTNDGNYRCPNSQQGFSGFTTWTRGLAWAMLGFAEELEFFDANSDIANQVDDFDGLQQIMLKAAQATCRFYIENTPTDGIPYWDTGAPNLNKLGDYLNRKSDPYNDFEPIDSSAAAIGIQGLLRLGTYLKKHGREKDGGTFFNAGLTALESLLGEPYLSIKNNHQGLLLHSIYHQPNGWDNIPEGRKIACGESSMWGDYHMRELILYVQKIIKNQEYYTYFN